MMKIQPYKVIADFEQALCDYTGAPFAVAVNSCTMALRLCLDWKYRNDRLKDDLNKLLPQNDDISNYAKSYVEIPKKTYISVPIQIKQAGFGVLFKNQSWEGMYELYPLGIYDSARRFHRNMFSEFTRNINGPTYQCVSFHWTKILGLGHGGAILHDDPKAQHFFKEMRHDGRTDGMPIDNAHIKYLGHHCPIQPEIAAQGLVRLANLPDYNDDLPNSDYPDLSTFEVFK